MKRLGFAARSRANDKGRFKTRVLNIALSSFGESKRLEKVLGLECGRLPFNAIKPAKFLLCRFITSAVLTDCCEFQFYTYLFTNYLKIKEDLL